MELAYCNANFGNGNQSTLFKFSEEGQSRVYCILIDCGPGLDLDNLLSDDEHLLATLITHGHQDHIASLDESLRDGAPIQTSADTKEIIETTLSIDGGDLGVRNPDEVISNINVLDNEWERLIEGIEIRAVPVGHAPGAVGFVIRFDGDKHIYVTGDFTTHSVAGNPGFDCEFNGALLPLMGDKQEITGYNPDTEGGDGSDEIGEFGVDVLHINLPAREDAIEGVNAGIKKIIERVGQGSSVVVPSTALGGLHIASLLDEFQKKGRPFEVTLLGKGATIAENLGYGFEQVAVVPDFASSGEYIGPGKVAIAGPDDGSFGASKQLLDSVNQDNGNASVIQFSNSISSTIEKPGTTVHKFEYSLHPSRKQFDNVIGRLEPIYTLVSHTDNKERLKKWRDRGRDLQTIILGSFWDRNYTLYRNGTWVRPDWIDKPFGNRVIRRSNNRRYNRVDGARLPSLRREQISLESEGIDIELDEENGEKVRQVARGQEAKGVTSDVTDEVQIDVPSVSFELDAVVLEVVRRVVGSDSAEQSVDEFIVESVDEFIARMLQGEEVKLRSSTPLAEAVQIDEDSLLGFLISTETGKQQVDPESVVVDTLRKRFSVPKGSVVYENVELESRLVYIEGLVKNNETEFASSSEVVQTAIEAGLESELATGEKEETETAKEVEVTSSP